MMAWLTCMTPNGYRVLSKPWPACLTGWACGQIFGKNVGMVCHPVQAAGDLLEVEYGRRVTGEGPTYRKSLKGQVSCR